LLLVWRIGRQKTAQNHAVLRLHRWEAPAPPVPARPLDRNDGSSPRSAPAASDPGYEIEHLGVRTELELQQGRRRRQQRYVMAGGRRIQLYQVAPPEIFDPRQV